jgi:NAD(P)-dependent dehydrogenase (short-subunit alcohol dehydrogenase family)
MGVMLVTGAGRGIGAAIARLAGRSGWDVAVNYARSRDRAERVAREIRAMDRRAVAVQADVAREADVVRMFRDVDAELGPVSALVNNAAIDHEGAVVDSAVEDLERVIRVNVVGPWVCAREAIRLMSTARGGAGGVIVNISSISARTGGLPRDVMYATSKGALDAFTLGLAKEVGREGIRAVSVRPGITRTEIFDHVTGGLDRVNEIARRDTAIGRIAEAEEVAELVVWLCSAAASYVTGTAYDVSAGR